MTKSKLNSLLLLSSVDIFSFNFLGANLRPFIPLLLIYLILDFFSLLSNPTNMRKIRKSDLRSIALMLSIFTLMMLHSIFFSVNLVSSIKVCYLMLFNAISGIYVYRLIKYNLNYLTLPAILKFNIIFTSVLIIVQFVLSILNLYQPIKYGLEGFGGYGRPSALFDDPGWVAWWLGFLFILNGVLNNLFNLRQSKWVLFFVLLAAILSGSRTLIFILILSFAIVYRNKIRLLAFVSIFFAFVIILIYGVPENLYYDLIDLERNPRLNDTNLIMSFIFDNKKELVGVGAGNLSVINEENESRNVTTSNVFFLTIFHDYGYPGLVVIFMLFIYSYTLLKTSKLKLFFILLFFMLNIHNATPKVIFWIILALFYSVDWIVFSTKNRPGSKEEFAPILKAGSPDA